MNTASGVQRCRFISSAFPHVHQEPGSGPGRGAQVALGRDRSLPPDTLTVVNPTSVRRAREVLQGLEGVGTGVEESA